MASLDIVKIPHEISFSRNPIVFRFKVAPYSNDDAAINTQISVTLFAESSHYQEDFAAIKTITLRPDTDGFAEIDWSGLLDSQLEFYVPKIGDTTIQTCNKQGARYYVRYSVANDYEQAVAPQESPRLHVIKGGLAYEQWTSRDFFDQKIVNDKEYLRYGYDREEAGPDEPLYAYFLDPFGFNFLAGEKLHAFISIRALPGNTLPNTSVFTTDGGGKWQIYCVAIGYAQQALAALLPAGNFADSLFLEVANSSVTLITRLLEIKLNYRNYYDTRTLHYHNSLGGLDTQVMRGAIDISGSYDKQTVSLLDASAYARGRVLKAINRQDDSRETAQLKGDTGWIPQARAERLRDLLNSNRSWELIGNRLKPVQILPKNATLYSNTDKLFSLAVDWQDAFADANFTPDNYLGQSTSCPEVEWLAAGQEVQAQLRVNWQLPEGYDLVEIRFSDTNTLPAPNPSLQYFIGKNAGNIDLPVPFTNINSNISPMTIYVWARVVCDNLSTPIIAGPWKGYVSTVMTKYIAPIAKNIFVTTYQGAGARFLPMASLLSYITKRNPGSTVTSFNVSVPSTSSAVGNVYNNPGVIIGYNPPTAGFSGVDTVTYSCVEGISPGVVSPVATGKIYITVSPNSVTGSSLTGKVYVQLVSTPGPDRLVTIGISLTRVSTVMLSLAFFKDPLGTIPYNVTGLGLNVTMTPTQLVGGATITYPNQTFACSGTSTAIYNDNTTPYPLSGGWFGGSKAWSYTYTLVNTGTYFVL